MSTAVAKRESTAVKHQMTISELVVEINKRIYDAYSAQNRCNKLRLKAGLLLLQLRQRIESGEEGDVGWWEWFGNLGNNGHHPTLVRGRKDAERLMRIASAEDPEQALEDERAKDRDRKRLARSGADKADVRSKPKGMMPDGSLVLETFTPCGTPIAYRDRDGDYKLGAMPEELRAEYAAAVAAAAEHDISKRTVERAIAKAEGKTPKPKRDAYVQPELTPRPESESREASVVTMLSQAWDLAEHVKDRIAEADLSLDVETMEAVFQVADAWAALAADLRAKREPERCQHTAEMILEALLPEDDIGDIPPELDRRRS